MTDLFNTGVRPVIDNWLLEKSKEKRDYGNYWSASSAGYCQRKVIFERLGVPHVEKEDDARKQRVFTSGHIFHSWIQELTKEAGISVAQELELEDTSLMIRGHIDDLVLVNVPDIELYEGQNKKFNNNPRPQQYPILYDYKTRNSKNFNFAKQPSYFHRLQLGTYLYMLRNLKLQSVLGLRNAPLVNSLTEARTLNIEKDTLRMAEVKYLWNAQLEKDVLDYWTSLNRHWVTRTLPKCTCADHEGGFMAKEKWNPYFYGGEPCSLVWYEKWKSRQLEYGGMDLGIGETKP